MGRTSQPDGSHPGPRNFDRIAQQLILAAKLPVSQRIALLRRMCPELVQQAKADRGSAGPLIFWGQCLNTDELAAQIIVDPTILETLAAIVGHPAPKGIVHAGLQHTYGYLFSLIDTPYGRKRDRWISSSLEAGFGLPTDVLGPKPGQGTLLANATWLAGSIAFRGHRRRRWLLRCLSRRISPALQTIPYDRLQGLRLSESVTLSNARGADRKVVLVTDLVRMPGQTADSRQKNWLLVYSIHNGRRADPQLITMFEVDEEFTRGICHRGATRRHDDIRPRYNAYVQGFPAEPQTGLLQLTKR